MVKHVPFIKLTVVVFCLVRSLSPLLSINGEYSWFSQGKKFPIAHIVQDGITFCSPFPDPI